MKLLFHSLPLVQRVPLMLFCLSVWGAWLLGIAFWPMPTAAQKQAYTIQVAVKNTQEQAEVLVQELKAKGLDAAWIKPEDSNQTPRFLVRVGRYATDAAARMACAQMRQKNLVSECFSLPYQTTGKEVAAATKPTGKPIAAGRAATPKPTVTTAATAEKKETTPAPIEGAVAIAPVPASRPTPLPPVAAQGPENIRVAVFKPQVKQGSKISAVAVADRLIAELRDKATGIEINLLENAVDRETAKRVALEQGFTYLVFLTVSKEDIKQNQNAGQRILGGLGKKLPVPVKPSDPKTNYLTRAEIIFVALRQTMSPFATNVEAYEDGNEKSVASSCHPSAMSLLSRHKRRKRL